jgi:hypothetical protein
MHSRMMIPGQVSVQPATQQAAWSQHVRSQKGSVELLKEIITPGVEILQQQLYTHLSPYRSLASKVVTEFL